MSETPESTLSVTDSIRGYVQQAFDNGIDLSVKSNRESMIKQFKDAFPKENPKTISTLFGKEIPKIAKAYNINPDDVKQKPAKKYSKDNEISITPTEQKSGIQTVSIKNPDVVGNQPTPIMQGQPQQYKYVVKSSQVSAFSNALFGIGQVFSEDLEDLTDDEAEDIGDLWQPILQEKIGNSEKGQTALAVGGTLGIVARKAKKAKDNRKIRKSKEAKERGTAIEPKKESG